MDPSPTLMTFDAMPDGVLSAPGGGAATSGGAGISPGAGSSLSVQPATRQTMNSGTRARRIMEPILSHDMISRMRVLMAAILASTALAGAPTAQTRLHAPFDKILDTYVRDGYVYYHALQKERAP